MDNEQIYIKEWSLTQVTLSNGDVIVAKPGEELDIDAIEKALENN